MNRNSRVAVHRTPDRCRQQLSRPCLDTATAVRDSAVVTGAGPGLSAWTASSATLCRQPGLVPPHRVVGGLPISPRGGLGVLAACAASCSRAGLCFACAVVESAIRRWSADQGRGEVGECDREGKPGGCGFFCPVSCPLVGEQGADEQEDHPGGRGHAEEVPP